MCYYDLAISSSRLSNLSCMVLPGGCAFHKFSQNAYIEIPGSRGDSPLVFSRVLAINPLDPRWTYMSKQIPTSNGKSSTHFRKNIFYILKDFALIFQKKQESKSFVHRVFIWMLGGRRDRHGKYCFLTNTP